MAATANCPKCTQPVTIPEGLEPDAVVRCPTCEAEYPLSEALPGATQQEEAGSDTVAFLKSLETVGLGSGAAEIAPPELVPVASVSEDIPSATAAEAAAEEPIMLVEVEDESQQGPAEGPQQDEEASSIIETDVVLEEVEERDESGLTLEEVGGEASEDTEAGEQPVAVPDELRVETEEPQTETVEPREEAETEAKSSGVVYEPPAVVETEGEPAGAPEQGAEEGQPAPAAEEATEGEPAEEEEVPTAVDPDPLVRGPHGDAEFRLSELIVVSTGLALGKTTASVIAAHGLLRPLAEGEAEAAKEAPVLDVWGKVEAAPQLDLGYAAGAAATDHVGFAIQEAGPADEPAARTLPAQPRRKRKEKSAVRTIVEVVLGGVIAVPLAAYLAVMIKGDQANFLNAPLPGCPSTYQHCPDWWPQWLKIGAREEDAASEDASVTATAAPKAGANAKTPKPGAKKPHGKKTPSPQPEAGEPPKPEPANKPDKTHKSKSDPAASVGPLNVSSYTSDQLGEALAKANAALGCKNCNSTGKVTKIVTEIQEIGGKKKEVKKKKTVECEVCHGHPIRVMNDAAYGAFCWMSKVATFVRGADDDAQLADRKRAVRNLAEKAGGSDAELARIGDLAAARLADAGRVESGIFLAGTVQNTSPRGAVHVSEILLSSSGKGSTVTVLSPRSLPAAPNDRVLILGSIVEEPRESLAGYEGPEPLVIWAGECVKVR